MFDLKEFSEKYEVDSADKIQRENVDRYVKLINIDIYENLRDFPNHAANLDFYKSCDYISKHYKR